MQGSVSPVAFDLTTYISIRSLSEEEDDMLDKLDPAIRYLQKLGSEYLNLVFQNARWVLDINREMGLQVFSLLLLTELSLLKLCAKIFTAEDAQLPRDKVSEFLMNISPALCAGYMEYLIDEAGEANPVFHDRLAELYLRASMDPKATEGKHMTK